MIFQEYALIAVLLLGITSVYLLVSQNWRFSIAALAVQYLAVFWLVALVWPFGLAAVKLVAGWMAGAVLSASRPEEHIQEDQTPGASGALFRLIAAGLMLSLIFSSLPTARARLSTLPVLLEGGLILIGLGLLHLGMSTRPLRVVIGLLTVLSGFELLYAGLETSILIAGLQAVATLGLALVGAYLLAVPDMEENG
jgi:hypothetical protein